MKRLAWFTLLVLATLMLALIFWEFRTAVVLFGLSLAVAAALRPLVDRLTVRGVPRGLALSVTYVVCIGGLIALVLILSGPLLTDLQQITRELASGYEQLKAQQPVGSSPLQQLFASQLPAAAELSTAITGPQGGAVLQAVLGLTMGSFDLVGQLMIVLVLSIYWSADQEHFKRLWLSLLSVQTRVQARDVWQNIEDGFGAYLRSQTIQSVLAVLLLALGYQALGLRYPITLALIGAIGWLIPWVGVLVAVVPAVWMGLSISLGLGVFAALLTIGVLAFLEFIVEPRLFKREQFSSLLAVIMLLVLSDEYGLMGILVAPPIAAAIQIIAGQLWRAMTRSIVAPSERPIVSVQSIETLQVQLAHVQARLAAQPESRPELNNLVRRLEQLIEQAALEERRLTEAGAVPSHFEVQPSAGMIS
jgi:predicted PurR-regulated permease PerM